MKQLSLTLNIVFAAALVFLYIKVFSGQKNVQSAIVQQPKVLAIPPGGNAPIAYIELDSLNDKIDYIKARRGALEAEQKEIEAEFRTGYAGLESRRNAFIKKGNSVTQEDAEKFQNQLLQDQQEIDGRKQELTQKLSEKSYQFMDDIQKKLKDFLSDYNRDGRYQYILTTGTGLDYMLYKDSSYNITDDVIKGMNEKMKKL